MPNLFDQTYMGQGLRRYVSWNPLNYLRPAERFHVSDSLVFSDVDLLDVSFYQKLIDFNKMKAAGARGVIVRAGQNLWKDPYFEINWQAAKDSGLPRGSYYMLDPLATSKAQADLYWSMIKSDPGELMAVADFELVGWRALYDFNERLLSNGLPREKLWIYTGYYYWLDHSPQSDPSALSYFAQFPLWLAWYTSNPANVKIPNPWKDSTTKLWQTGTPPEGAKYGVQTVEIDKDKWNGDLNSYLTYFHLGGETLPPEPGGKMRYEVVSNVPTETRAIRRGPGIIYGSVINLPAGMKAIGDFKYTYTATLVTDGLTRALAGDAWVHVTSPTDGWIAQTHLSRAYTNVTATPDTTPADTITSVKTSQEMVVTHADGRVETFRGIDITLPKV